MAEPAWSSVHLHFEGRLWSAEADAVILDVVAPLARLARQRRLADRVFFVRYTRDGSHVRCRLRRLPGVGEERLRACVEDAVRRGEGSPVERLAWVPYEPELDRYGGAAGVAVAEEVFDASSRLVLALLSGLAGRDRRSRLGRALLAMVAALSVYRPTAREAAEASRHYGRSYLRHMVQEEASQSHFQDAFDGGFQRQAARLVGLVAGLWSTLEGGGGLPAEVAAYRAALASALARLRRLHRRGELTGGAAAGRPWPIAQAAIFPSYLHMTNNRLGLTVAEECYLASLIAESLEGAEAAPPAIGSRGITDRGGTAA